MKRTWTYYAELACRWYVFFIMNVYGLGKIVGGQFYRRGQLPAKVAAQTMDQVSAFDLAWTFMGYSYAYILFVGLAQVVGALLLVIHRTKLLGALILFTVVLNIVVFDFIYMDKDGATLTACVCLFMICLVFLFNHKKLISVFKELLAKPEKREKNFKRGLITAVVTIAIITLIFFAELQVRNLIGN